MIRKSDLVFFLFLLINLIGYRSGILKYLLAIFIIGLILISKIYTKNNRELRLKYLVILLLPSLFYIIYSLIAVLFNGDFNHYIFYIKDSLFIILPVALAFFIVNIFKGKQICEYMFYSIILSFFIMELRSLDIENLMESPYCFIFGVYVLYFIYKRNNKNIIISLIMVFLSNKRIVWGALFLSVIIWYIIKNRKNNKLNCIIEILVIIGIYMYIYIVKSGTLRYIFREYGINDQGRLHLYSLFESRYNIDILFMGRGLGYVQYILDSINYPINLLHNDLLANYIQLGCISLLIYLMLIFFTCRFLRKINREFSTYYFIIILYTLMLGATDNVTIYFIYLLPLYLIVFYEIKINIIEKRSS